jgi:hypothetical protein
MERIHGETMEQLWPRLGIWATIRIAWQLRSFVSAMRTVTTQKTGGLHSGEVHSEWVQGMYVPVPHASPSVFCDYLNWWLLKARPSTPATSALATSRTCFGSSRPSPTKHDFGFERSPMAY